MARPFLIIELCGDCARAGYYPGGDAKTSYASVPASAGTKETVAALLEALGEKVKSALGSCSVYLSVPPGSVITRVVNVPVDKREKINDMLPFELDGLLSVDTEEVVMDNIPLGEGKAIAVAMEKTTLAQYLSALGGLGMDPAWVGVAGLSMPRLLGSLYGNAGTKAFVGEDFISVSTGARPVYFSAYSAVAGLKLNLSYLEAEGIKIDSVYGTARSLAGVERVLPGVPATEVAPPDGLAPEAAAISALASDVKKGSIAQSVNLRKGEFEYTKEKAAGRKKLRLTFVLAMVVAVLLLGDAYLRYMTLHSELATYKKSLRAAYTELFPNERIEIGELYQLSAKLKTMEKQTALVNGRPSVLDVMNGFVRAAGKDPALGIRVTEMSIAEGHVKATGEAASFDAANRFKELLSRDKTFKSVQISDLKSKAGSGAAFSLSISVI